jgi:hypothetical protein
MSEEIVDNKVDESEKLDRLKQKADLLGITYNAKIGLEKLKLKVDLFLEEQEDKTPVNESSTGPSNKILDAEKKAKKPVYAIVKDLDATQQNDPTIVVNIGNKYFKIGCIVTKGKAELIPSAIIDALKAKPMVEWVDEKHAMTKRPTGNRVARTTKRYSIEILDANPKIEDYK